MSSPLNTPLSNQFVCPTNSQIGASLRPDQDAKCTYLCGNSLGLMSERSKTLVQEELDAWGSCGVVGHFKHPKNRPWVEYTDKLTPLMAEVVGAKEKEVAVMSTLTSNLHLMMDSFYKPTPGRYKILCEGKAFPSDQYAFKSQALAHGLDPTSAILELHPREGEHILREEDILKVLEEQGASIALVIFSGVQYYTGQLFPMEPVTRMAKEKGCICGWDLAHAVGNVPLRLHDWNVDFAVWCTYKYLNSGPGGIAGLFMHERWNNIERPKFAGWWGHELATRFEMPPVFSPITGAQGFQQSNPSTLALASLLGSLEALQEAGMMNPVRERSIQLTGAFEELLKQSKYFVPTSEVQKRHTQSHSTNPGFTIITPENPSSRGAQLSLLFLPVGSGVMQKVFDKLVLYGVIGDERQPDVIRLAPHSLYNTLEDCQNAAKYLDEAMGHGLL
ncbi:hypothetical protein AGABI2DRAFT_190561 [Agaricus bisporus var. bisporus H97]|uniref:hypothetical protein n=1 Tax=Agaricus bisporus var. bisporus (strain H97 / ATCC MYA-4626 / FGSC 10389) TaxID=936046 RepID=UPI00029F5C27|nr:hypothetical protein AGABI2DRAFT_190561 [Agaricus bisporus var. bisporus H97]EKV50159.1 hypothetical protein AGABI2DRAFT_190561 [Agaricus bisporus var. bisporus H97]